MVSLKAEVLKEPYQCIEGKKTSTWKALKSGWSLEINTKTSGQKNSAKNETKRRVCFAYY